MNIDTNHLQHENFNNIIQIPISKDNDSMNDVEGMKKAYTANMSLNSSEKMYDTGVNINPYENLTLKEKFYQLKGSRYISQKSRINGISKLSTSLRKR